MAEHPKAKRRSIRQIVRDWLYNGVFQPGMGRWVLLGLAAFVFLLSALFLGGSVDFREDPAALAPRSAQFFVETRDVKALLKNVAAWKIWLPEYRATGQEVNTELEKEAAAAISRRLAGLPLNAPLRWLTGSSGAALCVSPGGATDPDSWALYLRLENTSAALTEMEVEPEMTLERLDGTCENGVFVLTDAAGRRLHVGVVAPWLILSDDEKLPRFALDTRKKPALSLAGAGVIPRWKRSNSVRGIVNPSAISAERSGGLAIPNWLASEARVTFTAKLGRSGEVESTLNTVLMSDRIGGGIWPLFKIIVFVIALVSLILMLATLVVMVGWGGWLKTLAARAGIAPAKAPLAVTPSMAFREDSGLRVGSEEQVDVMKETSPERIESVAAQPQEVEAAEIISSESVGDVSSEPLSESVTGITEIPVEAELDENGETGTDTNRSTNE